MLLLYEQQTSLDARKCYKNKKNGRDFETGGEKILKYTLVHICTKFQIS